MKEGTSGTLSKISKIYKGEPITKKVKKVEKKAMGGRIGYNLVAKILTWKHSS